MPTRDLLRRSYLCSQLSDAELQQLLDIVSLRAVEKGEILFLEGDVAAGFYLLLEGQVRVFKSSPEGREHTLHRIQPGQIFAEAAIFHGERYPANCEALVESTVAFFPKERFVNLILKSPQISLKMIGSLSQFLREFNQTIEMLSLKEVSARLATFLLNLQERSRSTTVTLPMTKAQLADKLGTISETLSRNLRKFIDLGVITVDSKEIALLDLERLRSIADGEKI